MPHNRFTAAVLGVISAAASILLLQKYFPHIIPPSLTIQISANPSAGVAPLTTQITGTIKDQSGNLVPVSTLYLFANGQQVANFSSSDGNISYIMTINQPGTYQVFVADNPQGT